jgi:hypothetical protein
MTDTSPGTPEQLPIPIHTPITDLCLLYSGQAAHGVSIAGIDGLSLLFAATLPQSAGTANLNILNPAGEWLGAIEFPLAAVGQPLGLIVYGKLQTHYRNDQGQTLPFAFQYDSFAHLNQWPHSL